MTGDVVQSIARDRIIETARSWLGVPFRHQGRSRRGIDCIGFVWAVGRELGIEATVPSNYSQAPSGHLVLEGCGKYLVKPENQRDILPGQVAILWGISIGVPQHFAIVGSHAGLPTLIHAFSKRGEVVENPYDVFWLKRLMALYEYPGTEPWKG